MNKPKNLILEEVPDKEMRDFFYALHESEIPLYYTHHERPIPKAPNVFNFPNIKILVAPNNTQGQYIDKRVLDLYDDLSPNLKDMAEEIVMWNNDLGIPRVLRELLTQHDADETAEYLKKSLEDGTLYNFAEIIPKEKYENSNGMIETYAFYLKGDLKSYGITVERGGDCYCLFFDEDDRHTRALSYFEQNVRNEDADLYRKFRMQQNQM